MYAFQMRSSKTIFKANWRFVKLQKA